MHIILAIAGIAAAFGYYWFAFRRTRDAVDDVVDMAGRARGAYKRRQFKNKVEASSLTAIGDPRTAAVVMAIAVASRDGHLGAEEEATLRDKMNSVLGVDNEDEEITFAKWVVQENQDPNNISLRLGKLWTGSLSMQERQDFVDLVSDVAQAGGHLSHLQVEAIDRLRSRLHIV